MECEVLKVTMVSQDRRAMTDELDALDLWVLLDRQELWWKGKRC